MPSPLPAAAAGWRSQSAASVLGNKSTVSRSREIDALDHPRRPPARRRRRRRPVPRGSRARSDSDRPEMAISDPPTDCRGGRGRGGGEGLVAPSLYLAPGRIRGMDNHRIEPARLLRVPRAIIKHPTSSLQQLLSHRRLTYLYKIASRCQIYSDRAGEFFARYKNADLGDVVDNLLQISSKLCYLVST